jgi:uncharacterized protein
VADRIDCDVHPSFSGIADLLPHMPEEWREFFTSSAQYRMTPLDEFHPVNARSGTPIEAITDMLDASGTETALAVAPQGGSVNGWTDRLSASAYVSAVNDHLTDVWSSADRRLRVAVVVSPLDPEQAAEEIRRKADDRSVWAVFLPPINVMLGDRHYDPIYAAAQGAGLPVVVHPTVAEGTLLGPPGFAAGVPATRAERMALLPEIAYSALASLTLRGTFERFRDLRIVFSGYGWSWIASALWEMDRRWEEFRDDFGTAPRRPSEYAAAHIRVVATHLGAVETDDRAWAHADAAGVTDMLVYGSEFPYGDPARAAEFTKGLPQSQTLALVRTTALALFADRL